MHRQHHELDGSAYPRSVRSLGSLTRWGPDDREILRLALPALGALVAEPLYILADTAVVGHLGTPQLGGLALASSILLIGHSIFIFLAYGTTARVARLLGADEHRRAAHYAVQSVWLALSVGVILTVAGLAFGEELISILGGRGEVAANAEVYLRISLFGVPAMLASLAGVGYLRGLQDTRRPLLVAVVTACGNLALELVLIYGFDQGIGASALATVVAQWSGAAIYGVWIARSVRSLQVDLAPDWGAIAGAAGGGLDLALRTIALRGGLTVTLAVAARLGTDDLAAHQIAFEVWSLLALALDAVAIAAQAMIGHALGSGDAGRARQLGRRMIEWGLWCGIVLGAVVALLSGILPGVFTADGSVSSLASFLLLHVAISQPVAGVAFALDGVLIGAEDLRFLAGAMWIATLVLVAGGLLVLEVDAGIGWLWASIHLWMLTRAALLLVRFRSSAWAVTGLPLH